MNGPFDMHDDHPRRSGRRRKAKMGALLLGSFLAFGMGFAHKHHHRGHRAHFERHVARICAEAALDTRAGENPDSQGPSAHHPEPATVDTSVRPHSETRHRRHHRHRRPHRSGHRGPGQNR